MPSDPELLARYLEAGDNEALAAIVQRHVDLVFSTAVRQVGGDVHAAADVSQLVFSDFVRKAGSLRERADLSGWFYTGVRYCSAQYVRTERRRRERELKAHAMSTINESSPPDADAGQLRRVLDDAMHELPDIDREIVILRFFDRLALAEVGRIFALSENAVSKRIERALDRLRERLATRGITSSGVALATALEASVSAAPASLGACITSSLISAGMAETAGAAGAAIGIMTAAKTTTVAAIAVIAICAALYENSANGRLRDENANLRSENSQLLREGGRAQSPGTEAPDKLAPDQAEIERLRAGLAAPTASGGSVTPAATTLPTGPDTDGQALAEDLRKATEEQLMADLDLNVRPFFDRIAGGQKWEAYRKLIAEANAVEADAVEIAKREHLSTRDIEQMIVKQNDEIKGELLALLGEEANNALIKLNRELPLRNVVGNLVGKLATSAWALTASQSEQMLNQLRADPTLSKGWINIPVLSEASLQKLSEVLTPDQLQVLRDQQERISLEQQIARAKKR